MLTYAEAQAKMSKSRTGTPKLMHNTYLREYYDHTTGTTDYQVRYHGTTVVTLHADGTYTLNTGGWNTLTTKRRLNDYGPASVYSHDGILVVVSKDDPRTRVRMQKCRKCHGTGTLHTKAYWERHGHLPHPVYETKTEYAFFHAVNGELHAGYYHSTLQGPCEPLMRGGKPIAADGHPMMIKVAGQVVRHDTGEWGVLPVPVFHPSEPYGCHSCGGTGKRDYGSKKRHVIFYDGITVDSSGKVTDPLALRLYATDDEKTTKAARDTLRAAAALARRIKEMKLRNMRARAEFLERYSLTPVDEKIVVYKSVDSALRSTYAIWDADSGTHHHFRYPIGESVACDDWDETPDCGGGLHFWPTVQQAVQWGDRTSRILACEINVDDMVVIYGNKVKVPRATVLYEVDSEGNRL